MTVLERARGRGQKCLPDELVGCPGTFPREGLPLMSPMLLTLPRASWLAPGSEVLEG